MDCPVCGEGFREPPARCFRCETDLSLWWALDESLRVLCRVAPAMPLSAVHDAAGVEPSPRRRRTRRRRVWVAPLLLVSGLGGALWLHLETSRPPADVPSGLTPSKSAPVPVTPSKSVPPAAPAPRRTVRYVVQPGDSLWRIAAALKGDARRWPELLAGSARVDPARLRPGQELRFVLDPPAAATPD